MHMYRVEQRRYDKAGEKIKQAEKKVKRVLKYFEFQWKIMRVNSLQSEFGWDERADKETTREAESLFGKGYSPCRHP